MKREDLVKIALGGVLADAITTVIGLEYPELKEANPWVNPFMEGACVTIFPYAIIKIGEKLKVHPKVVDVCAIAPITIPYLAALNNSILIALVHAKRYPWKECPLLYPE